MKRSVISIVIILALFLPQATYSQEEEPIDIDKIAPFEDRFTYYMEYPEMTQELHRLASEHSDIMELHDLTANTDLGQTWQGRAVWGMKVSDNPSSIEDEPRILLVGAHHAREWMSYEVCLYTLYYIAENYGMEKTDRDRDGRLGEDEIDGLDNDKDGKTDEDWSPARVTWLVNHCEIWLVPMLNPDGVSYDHEITGPGDTGGGWRKNCRDNDGNGIFNPDYDGVDLNRNYPYYWARNRYFRYMGEDGLMYTSDSGIPSSYSYRGPDDNVDQDGDSTFPAPDYWWQHNTRDWNGIDEDPVNSLDDDGDGLIDEDKDGGFSEPETQAIRGLVKTHTDEYGTGSLQFDVSITYHSYAELIIYPWGYTDTPCPDKDLFLDLGAQLSKYNGYEVVQGPELYATSGDYDDWMYGAADILSMTIELNSNSDGGFHPYEEMILPTCRIHNGVNMHACEVAGRAATAKLLQSPSLNVTIPNLELAQAPVGVGIPEDQAQEVMVVSDDPSMISSIELRYRVDKGEWRTLAMEEGDQSSFTASIPAQEKDSSIEYYVEARDPYGNYISAPTYGEGEPLSYQVTGTSNISVGWVLLVLIILGGGYFVSREFFITKGKRFTDILHPRK